MSTLARILVALTFFLIFWGGQVTTTLSGDSVPTWPSSFFVPKDMPQVWELGHRWIAGTVGLVTIALCVWTFLRPTPAIARRLAVAASVLVVMQASVGGVRVLLGEGHSNAWSVVHAMLAQGFLGLTVATAVALNPKSDAHAPRAVVRGFTLGAVAWLQAVLGAVLRHATQDRDPLGLVMHICGALLVIVAAVRLIALVKEDHGGDRRFTVPSHLVAAALVAQLGLGLAAWTTTHTASGYVNPTDIKSLIPTVHLVVGSGVIALGVLVAMRALGRSPA